MLCSSKSWSMLCLVGMARGSVLNARCPATVESVCCHGIFRRRQGAQLDDGNIQETLSALSKTVRLAVVCARVCSGSVPGCCGRCATRPQSLQRVPATTMPTHARPRPRPVGCVPDVYAAADACMRRRRLQITPLGAKREEDESPTNADHGVPLLGPVPGDLRAR